MEPNDREGFSKWCNEITPKRDQYKAGRLLIFVEDDIYHLWQSNRTKDERIADLTVARDSAILKWEWKADALDKVEREVMRMIVTHRRKEILTCPENCWCWGIEAVFLALEAQKEKP